MRLRQFENEARLAWWSVHVEAWRQSGLTRTAYCREHRLTKTTFDRWLEHLAGKDAARKQSEYQAELRRQRRLEERRKRPARRRFSVSTDVRSRAVQAFWAMHVEAMNWSGIGLREYAAALNLSPTSLRTWCRRFDEGEVEIDWRAHLHPSARPLVSTSANRETSGSGLTDGQNAVVPPLPERPTRRFFSDEAKRAIALESDQPGVSVSQVARRHGIVTGMLFRWRVEFGIAQKSRAKLAPVVIPDDTSAMLRLRDLVQPPAGMIAVELADGRRAFVPEGSDPAAVPVQAEGDGGAS